MDSEIPRNRCVWAGNDPLYQAYHDEEWGVPAHEDRHLFEFLILEGAQAGLSWITILRKRAAYRAAFAGFDPEVVARFDEAKVAKLLGVAQEFRHLSFIETGHYLGIESGKGGAVGRSLAQDGDPGKPGLGPFQNQELEQVSVF